MMMTALRSRLAVSLGLSLALGAFAPRCFRAAPSSKS